jgi:colanic acid/amylovoran biosynthesis glycosyltransferase
MKGDLFLCVSEYIRQKLITLGCDEQKAVILRCGVDTKKFCCSQRKPGNNGHVTILTIARLVEKKGVAYGIHAVAKLLKKHPQLEYRVVGDGPLKGELQNLIRELNATRNINLIGPKCQEEIFELLRGSDVFLAPSITGRDGDEEGIPTTIMEAFAQGLPVISTMHSGIPELVIDGESGFLVPERNVDALAEKLECLVEGPERRHRMGLRGREFVKEHHNIHTLNDRLIEIYRQ